MAIALIIGLFLAGIGALGSVATGNWQISFVVSGAVGVISIVISSMLRNMAVISRKRTHEKKEDGDRAAVEGEKWARTISLFGFPNILIAVVLYFKLYR